MHYNCLIVDDETELAKMTAEYFNMFEVSTAYVESGSECFEFLDKNDVDLILLDINLGDKSGFDLCRKIRENCRHAVSGRRHSVAARRGLARRYY